MINDLPRGWSSSRLEEMVTAQKGKKPAVSKLHPSPGFVPYLDIQALEKGIISAYAEAGSSRLGTASDLFIVWDGARSGWVGLGRDGAVGSTIMVLRPQVGERLYLHRWLESQFNLINTNTRGTGIPHVDPELFWNLKVPLPPLLEQRRIVAKLEVLLAKLEASRIRLAKLSVTIKRFRQSVLAAAYSGRLTTDWRDLNSNVESARVLLGRIQEKLMSSAGHKKRDRDVLQTIDSANIRIEDEEFEFGDLPESWTGCYIRDVSIVSNGSTPSRKEPKFWDGSIPWISSGEVRNNVIGDSRERITKAGYDGSSVRLLPRGTVLLAMIGEGKTRGQSAVLEIEATINQNIAAIVVDHGLVFPRYLWRWFQLQYEATRERGGGSGPQALNCERVRELPFVLPPLAEQEEIVHRTEALFVLADRIEVRLREAQKRVDTLRRSILAKAFRGELVVGEAELAAVEGRAVEPAKEVVKRSSDPLKTGNKYKTPKRRSARTSRM